MAPRRRYPRRNRNGHLAASREPESLDLQAPIIYNQAEVEDIRMQFEYASLEPSQLHGSKSKKRVRDD
jgi:hypothetical protein